MTHKGTVTLETERLILRKITLDDAVAMYQWMSDPEVCKYERWNSHPSVEYTQGSIREYYGAYDSDSKYHWGIQLSDELIGSVSIVGMNNADKKATLGYCLAQKHWSKGYVTEAVSKVVEFMFKEVELNRIEASCSVNNPASGKVLQKVGFVLEGHSKDYYYCNSGLQDSDLYAVTAYRYFSNRKPNTDFWSAIDALITSSEVIIDRPKGTKHPRFDFIYPLNYGYLKDTTSSDGGGIDVWHGSLNSNKCDAVICTVDLLKKDSEIKILLGCTEAEKDTILRFHNDSEYMKGVMIRRLNNGTSIL